MKKISGPWENGSKEVRPKMPLQLYFKILGKWSMDEKEGGSHVQTSMMFVILLLCIDNHDSLGSRIQLNIRCSYLANMDEGSLVSPINTSDGSCSLGGERGIEMLTRAIDDEFFIVYASRTLS